MSMKRRKQKTKIDQQQYPLGSSSTEIAVPLPKKVSTQVPTESIVASALIEGNLKSTFFLQ